MADDREEACPYCDARWLPKFRQHICQQSALKSKITELQNVLEGMVMEWDQLSRYGSPLAKAANERVAAARRLIKKPTGS